MLLLPHGLEQACQLIADGFATRLVHLCRNDVRTWSFPGSHLLDTKVGRDKPRETSDETEKRVVDFLHGQLGLTTITSDHISIAHRVGPYRQSQNRPIIVKFISRKTKVAVMKNKRNLKGQKIYINENLTKLNAQRLAALKKHFGVLSAWSFEGSHYCKLINLEKITIKEWRYRGD
ncbi:hypothetical protein ACOMHN_014863 [Nucella lapillus]